jgi:hypothetical protein
MTKHSWQSDYDEAVGMAQTMTTEMRLILAMAPSFQGGHCKTGGEVADYLGIPFPLTTTNLEKKAKECGFDPYDIWPWLKQIRSKKRMTGRCSNV